MLKVMGALVLYAIFFKSLGFLLTTFLLIAFLLRVIEPMSWKKVLAGAILTAVGSYFDLSSSGSRPNFPKEFSGSEKWIFRPM